MDAGLHLNDGEKLILERSAEDSVVYALLWNSVFPFLIVFALIWGAFSLLAPPSNQWTAQDIQLIHVLKIISLAILAFWVGLFYLFFSISVPQLMYILTDQRCIIYSGFIGTDKRIIPYNRIADVNIQQGTAEAVLGLSRVFIDEQAMNVSRGAWLLGLSMNDSEEIAKIISQHITQKQNK